VFILREGRVADQGPARRISLSTTLIVATEKERRKKVRQNGGVMAAKQRRTGGESAAEEFSCRSGPFLVLAFRSFLMKADLGEAGLIPLILRRQQQSHNRSIQAISTQNGFRQQRP
jgi:hypothetical protein